LFAGRWQGDAVKTFIFHQDPVAVYPQTFLGQVMDLDRVDKLFGFYWSFLRRLSNKFDATIVSGGWLQDRVSGFNLKNPVAVPFGIDKGFFSPERRNAELRKKLLRDIGLNEDATLLLSVSRFHPEKRLSTIIDGFKLASEKKPMGMIIVGSGPIQKWIEYKTKKIRHLKLMGFTSNRSELADIMASSDYFVHGSAAETFGMVVAEAICSGLPVVVPGRGGAVVLADPEIAEIYDTGNKIDLADALIRMLSKNRHEMVNACQTTAKNSIYTVDQHFDSLFELYQKMVDGKKKNEFII
jgi:alpha-1,6-mannosyltransferase